jgi:hypothetical protein
MHPPPPNICKKVMYAYIQVSRHGREHLGRTESCFLHVESIYVRVDTTLHTMLKMPKIQVFIWETFLLSKTSRKMNIFSVSLMYCTHFFWVLLSILYETRCVKKHTISH